MGGGESEKNIDELISKNICELIFYFFLVSVIFRLISVGYYKYPRF